MPQDTKDPTITYYLQNKIIVGNLKPQLSHLSPTNINLRIEFPDLNIFCYSPEMRINWNLTWITYSFSLICPDGPFKFRSWLLFHYEEKSYILFNKVKGEFIHWNWITSPLRSNEEDSKKLGSTRNLLFTSPNRKL